jgi:hypothetical protein
MPIKNPMTTAITMIPNMVKIHRKRLKELAAGAEFADIDEPR